MNIIDDNALIFEWEFPSDSQGRVSDFNKEFTRVISYLKKNLGLDFERTFYNKKIKVYLDIKLDNVKIYPVNPNDDHIQYVDFDGEQCYHSWTILKGEWFSIMEMDGIKIVYVKEILPVVKKEVNEFDDSTITWPALTPIEAKKPEETKYVVASKSKWADLADEESEIKPKASWMNLDMFDKSTPPNSTNSTTESITCSTISQPQVMKCYYCINFDCFKKNAGTHSIDKCRFFKECTYCKSKGIGVAGKGWGHTRDCCRKLHF
jgi:hypothetical protein